MLFTSLEFFIFLPLVLASFAITPVAQRWAVLLFASYVFYGFAQPFNLIYLGVVTLVVYGCGWCLERAKQQRVRVALFVIGLIAVLGSLTAFKFYNFIAGEIEHANLIANLKLPRLGATTPAGYSSMPSRPQATSSISTSGGCRAGKASARWHCSPHTFPRFSPARSSGRPISCRRCCPDCGPIRIASRSACN